MLDQLPTTARRLMDRLNEQNASEQESRGYDRRAMLRWAKHRYLAFSGAVAALVAALLIGQQAQPEWLG